MPYAVNVMKGSAVHNDDIGDLQGGIAKKISERQSLIAKHIRGVVVFDSIEEEIQKPIEQTSKKMNKIIESDLILKR